MLEGRQQAHPFTKLVCGYSCYPIFWRATRIAVSTCGSTVGHQTVASADARRGPLGISPGPRPALSPLHGSTERRFCDRHSSWMSIGGGADPDKVIPACLAPPCRFHFRSRRSPAAASRWDSQLLLPVRRVGKVRFERWDTPRPHDAAHHTSSLHDVGSHVGPTLRLLQILRLEIVQRSCVDGVPVEFILRMQIFIGSQNDPGTFRISDIR